MFYPSPSHQNNGKLPEIIPLSLILFRKFKKLPFTFQDLIFPSFNEDFFTYWIFSEKRRLGEPQEKNKWQKKNSSSSLSVSPRKTWAPESPAKGRRVASTASNTCTSIKSGVIAFVAGTTTLLAVIRAVFKWSSWSTSLFFWFCTALCYQKKSPNR